jgi:hypothetical protein
MRNIIFAVCWFLGVMIMSVFVCMIMAVEAIINLVQTGRISSMKQIG